MRAVRSDDPMTLKGLEGYLNPNISEPNGFSLIFVRAKTNHIGVKLF